MTEKPNPNPDAGMQLTISVDLPDDFVAVSELFNIDLEASIITYINNITVYNFLASHNGGITSQATQIFKKYHNVLLKTKGIQTAVQSKKHVEPIKQIVELISNNESVESPSYNTIISNWYSSVFPRHEDRKSN